MSGRLDPGRSDATGLIPRTGKRWSPSGESGADFAWGFPASSAAFESEPSMKGREIEVKLEVRDPRALKRRLAELGFRRVQARHFESNRLFDFPDRALRKAKRLLRLRFAKGRSLVTFKGRPVQSRDYKMRAEVETEVEDGRRLREILESVGLQEVFRYDKYRTAYAPGFGRKGTGASGASAARRGRRTGKAPERCEVVCDETPIGNYLELEGPRRWIDEVARQLGYRRWDYITSSYAALYERRCAEQGKKPGNMVFIARKPAR